MIAQQFTFKNKDHIKIHVYKWSPEKAAKGIIQIAHGMAETAKRYEYFAQAMTEEGFIVYANDHRGHGQSAISTKDLGYISDNDGFDDMVTDMKTLTGIAKKENPRLPVILFSHSMGSFLAQRYIQLYGDNIRGVILSGTNGRPEPILGVGTIIAKVIMKLGGRKASGKILDALSFGSYNKRIQGPKTKFDWLSTDEGQVEQYMNDPYCGTLFPVSFFYDLFKGLKIIHKKENLKQVPKNLHIFIFAGDEDPVGNYGKGIMDLYKTYQSLGIEDVTYKLYPKGRHEMLNEINRDEVIKDVIEWIDR